MEYEIYFPAGHFDWIGKYIPIAVTSSYEDMMHRVRYYHYGINNVQGPLYVKIVERD